MGQNQLLMVVLSIIIIAVSITVGMDQFGENAVTANRDAVAINCEHILSSAQQYFRKPAMLGGGGSTYTGVTLSAIGVDSVNANGTFTMTVSPPNELTIVGTGNQPVKGGGNVQVTLVHDASTEQVTYTDNL